MIDVTKVAHGVHGIVKLGAAEVFSGFGERRNEVWVLVQASETMANRCGKGARCCLSLCGGRLAAMKWISSKLKRRSAARATDRWPL